jgi:hypothetical protein
MEVDMNVYLVEDDPKDVEKIEGWINLVNGQLEDSKSALSRWCKMEGFNINIFNFNHFRGSGEFIGGNQCYCEEDVGRILSDLSENNEDKLLLLDIKLTEGQRDDRPAIIASKILNEIYSRPGLKIKVLVVTYISNVPDQLDELLTCNPLPRYISKAMLYPTFYTQQNLRAFVFFSQKGHFPGSEETGPLEKF